MLLQFKKTPVSFLSAAMQEVQKTELTQDFRIPEGMPDIGRVLTSWGQVLLRSKQWQANEISITGGVKLWTLYAPEDGTEPRCVESWLPYQLFWKTDSVDREGPVRIAALLTGADCRSVSARKMIFRASVSAIAEAFTSDEGAVCEPEAIPDHVELLQTTYPVRLPVECAEKTFLLDDEITLSGAAGQMEKLYSVTVHPLIRNADVVGDKLAVKGDAHLHLTGRNADGCIVSEWVFQPFSQIIRLDKSYGGDIYADILLAVTSLETDLTDDGKLRLKCGFSAQYLLDEPKLLTLVEDAYGTRQQVSPLMEELTLPVTVRQSAEDVNAEAMDTMQQGSCASMYLMLDFPVRNWGQETTALDLSGVFQGVVYDENGSPQGTANRWETQLHWDTGPDEKVLAVPTQTGEAVCIRTGSGMSYSAPVHISVRETGLRRFSMVSALEITEQQISDAGPSVILRRADGEALWTLAKEHGSTVREIREVNGLGEEETASGMLLIPVM